MPTILAQTTDTTPTEIVTTGTVYSWVDPAMAVALVFALAGAFFVGILLLRRRRQKTDSGS